MSDPTHDAIDATQPDPTPTPPQTAEQKRERRSPRPLSEKLEELAASARARIGKLQTREHRLIVDLGKVRSELQAARTELDKITGAAGRVTQREGPTGYTLAPPTTPPHINGHDETESAPF